jgi:RNA polymerase sigma-70 factor (ECF subfamily)
MKDRNKTLDAFLVLEYRSGNSKALGLLVKKYHTKLCKHAYWFTHDLHSSEDIVQDSWKSILTSLYKLKEPERFGSWAFRIVTRKALDHFNKQKKRQQELQKYSILADTGMTDTSTDDRVPLLQKAILTLPVNQQVVIRLFYTEGYSLNEMSEILEIAVGTVKSRLFHGREKLKIILKR